MLNLQMSVFHVLPIPIDPKNGSVSFNDDYISKELPNLIPRTFNEPSKTLKRKICYFGYVFQMRCKIVDSRPGILQPMYPWTASQSSVNNSDIRHVGLT